MRRVLLKLGIISALLFVIIFIFGGQLAPLFEKLGHPAEVQNTVLSYLLLIAVACAGLYFLKPLIGIFILLLLVLLLFMLFQMDVIHLINIVG